MKKKNFYWIGGKHSVNEILKDNTRDYLKILSTKPIPQFINNKKFFIKSKHYINNLFTKNFNHQGIAILVERKKFNDVKQNIKNITNIVIMNGVSDERNIGASIRNCVAFGIDSILIEKKNYPSTSSIIEKTSSGMVEKIKLYLTSNILNTIKILKENNFSIFGFDNKGKNNLHEFKDWSNRNAFIFGSESKGISESIYAKCDKIIKIQISDQVNSLNLSTSVGIAMAYFKNNK